ncbi:MAG: hypothetical protein LBI33_05340 [Propionibacteriaceae bacterium]|jgi:K+-sensing histidine kinase KdpD|nr:hypothetical protein [Propionibacteriaceae bacterium]
MNTTHLTDEQLADWMETSNNGAGPTPRSSISRADLDDLLVAVTERDRAERHVAHAAKTAHAAGATWTIIGQALGMTRQGAHKKYAGSQP